VGEIGIHRREFLYDLRFWEVRRIIRGYRRRDRLTHQLLAECAYAAMYSNRDSHGKTVADTFPILFNDDDEDDDTEPPISEEDASDLRQLINAVNARHRQQDSKSTEV
jgi:hypothetical protein